MSTRKKGKGNVGLLHTFINRAKATDDEFATFMLTLRMGRELLVSKDAVVDHWIDLADAINVAGFFAQERGNDWWFKVLKAGAAGLRSIAQRHERVGGRWAANETEMYQITDALNIIDGWILPAMTAPDFVRLTERLNAIKEGWKKEEQNGLR